MFYTKTNKNLQQLSLQLTKSRNNSIVLQWVYRRTVAHLQNGILFIKKKRKENEFTQLTYVCISNILYYIKEQNTVSKCYILYSSHFFWKRSKYRSKDQWLPEVGKGVGVHIKKQHEEILWNNKIFLYSVLVITRIYLHVRNHNCTLLKK